MLVLYAVAAVATAAFGLTLLKDELMQRERRLKRPVGAQPGDVVHQDYLGDQAAVKVYWINNAYEAHVYWHAQFIGRAGGFGTPKAAVGWGRSFARSKGANV